MIASDALLPVIVAELDDEGRESVLELAERREIGWIPLLEAPADASMHVLELVTPNGGPPVLVLAEPSGAPTALGFPLRLHPYDAPPVARSQSAPEPAASRRRLRATRRYDDALIAGTSGTAHDPGGTLSEAHVRELASSGRDTLAPPRTGPGRVIANGKIVIEEQVGNGGMGVVYRARHTQQDRPIAVKVLHERFQKDLTFCARFQAEALAISALDHPHLVRMVDYGQEADGTLYLAMDLLEGPELAVVLRRETLALPRILDIAMQIAGGLAHAHARGIVHRDVKPSNVILVDEVGEDGRKRVTAKLCDFGIATREGAQELVGTPAYMSPEQIRGESVDGRSDVYSLGVLLYEMATGQLPFDDADAAKVLALQLHRGPLALSLIRPVDDRLEALVMRMLAKSPEERPKGMREVRAELRAIEAPRAVVVRAAPDLFGVGAGRGDRTQPADGGAAPPPAPPLLMSSARMLAVSDPTPLANRLAAEPMSTLREMLTSVPRFTQEIETMTAALRILVRRVAVDALHPILGVLCAIARDGTDPRAPLVLKVVRALCDPALLAPLAERALSEHDEAAPAVLASLGLASAHALYAARVRLAPTSPVRGRFVAALRGIGPAAMPLLSAALERNAPADTQAHDAKLAEDLLRALEPVASQGRALGATLPEQQDDALGALLARYLRWGDDAVRRASVAPLVNAWRERARPLLLGALTSDADEGVRLAAVRGLHRLRAVDEHLVRKVEPMLAASGIELRVALADALASAAPEARAVAAEVLRRALVPKAGVLGVRRTSAGVGPAELVLALARAYVSVSPADARSVIGELARTADPALSTQLASLLENRSG